MISTSTYPCRSAISELAAAGNCCLGLLQLALQTLVLFFGCLLQFRTFDHVPLLIHKLLKRGTEK
jgi:hypothetical protein